MLRGDSFHHPGRCAAKLRGMNGQLNKHIVNPWLASTISFALITGFFMGATMIVPIQLPTRNDVAELPGGP